MYTDYSTGRVYGIKAKLGFKKLMTMEDFFIFLYESKLMNEEYDEFWVVDARLIFLRSKLIVDDTRKMPLHKLLLFPDFLEALTRLFCVPTIFTSWLTEAKVKDDGQPFAVLFGRFIDFLVDILYVSDNLTDKLFRRFTSVRNLPFSQKEKIPLPHIRQIVLKETSKRY